MPDLPRVRRILTNSEAGKEGGGKEAGITTLTLLVKQAGIALGRRQHQPTVKREGGRENRRREHQPPVKREGKGGVVPLEKRYTSAQRSLPASKEENNLCAEASPSLPKERE